MKLGITGGIGAGKSFVAEMLNREFGIPVYDCDREAKRLNVESSEIRRRLIQFIGKDVYTQDGALCKPTLARYLFESKENAARVNAIIHPVVAQDFLQWAEQKQSAANPPALIVGMESAILFESGFDRLVDKVLCVTAPLELRLQRACQRDKAKAESIRKRIRLQMTEEERTTKSDFIIMNDGRDLRPQIQAIINQIKRIELC